MSTVDVFLHADVWLNISVYLHLRDIAVMHRVSKAFNTAMDSLLLWELLIERDAPADVVSTAFHRSGEDATPLDRLTPGSTKALYRRLRLDARQILREMQKVPWGYGPSELRCDLQAKWWFRADVCGISAIKSNRGTTGAISFTVTPHDEEFLAEMRGRLLRQVAPPDEAHTSSSTQRDAGIQRFVPSPADVRMLLQRTATMARCVEGMEAARFRFYCYSVVGASMIAYTQRQPPSRRTATTKAVQALRIMWLRTFTERFIGYTDWLSAEPFSRATLTRNLLRECAIGELLNPRAQVAAAAFVALGAVRALYFSSPQQVARDRFLLVAVGNTVGWALFAETLFYIGTARVFPSGYRVGLSCVTGVTSLIAFVKLANMMKNRRNIAWAEWRETGWRLATIAALVVLPRLLVAAHVSLAHYLVVPLKLVWPPSAPIQPHAISFAANDADGASSHLLSEICRLACNILIRRTEQTITFNYQTPSVLGWTRVEPARTQAFLERNAVALTVAEDVLGTLIEVSAGLAYGNPAVGSMVRGVLKMAQTACYSVGCVIKYRCDEATWWCG